MGCKYNMNLSQKLINWYTENKRNLPWRGSQDVFKIWLSEIIMQQTRIEQGTKYYFFFTENFQNVYELASASEEKIMRMWQGLGYYSRARNLHSAARQVAEEFDGQFPETYNELIKLKGIGDYTAAAIASIVRNEQVPAVDGNVKRVISRLFDIRDPVDNQTTYNQIRKLAKSMMIDQEAGTFNQAMMDFGAMVCKPRNPDCENCPLQEHCLAYQTNIVAERPVKYRKQKKSKRFFNYLVFDIKVNKRKYFLIQKRTGKDIWNRLFQFPVIESHRLMNEKEILQNPAALHLTKNTKPLIFLSSSYRHNLSHREIHARFFQIRLDELPDSIPEDWQLILQKNLDQYGIPRLIEEYMEKEFRAW